MTSPYQRISVLRLQAVHRLVICPLLIALMFVVPAIGQDVTSQQSATDRNVLNKLLGEDVLSTNVFAVMSSDETGRGTRGR